MTPGMPLTDVVGVAEEAVGEEEGSFSECENARLMNSSRKSRSILSIFSRDENREWRNVCSNQRKLEFVSRKT
jgi:hypothetical protein